MLTDFSLKSISLKQHAQLLSALISPPLRIRLRNFNGDTIAEYTELTDGEQITATSNREEHYGFQENIDVVSHLGEKHGSVEISIMQSDKRVKAAFKRACEAVVNQINQEYQLNAELNAMAIELAERYEELNLIYNTRSNTLPGFVNKKFTNIRESLNKLVINCKEHLNVRESILLLPDKNIILESSTTNNEGSDIPQTTPELRQSIYQWIVNKRHSFLVNKVEDLPDSRIKLEKNCKILACPVFEGDDYLSGMVMVVNPVKDNHFTNSDRNLLEIIALNITKLLLKSYDPLTGLMNRETFKRQLKRTIRNKEPSKREDHLLWIKINQLNYFMDTLGHIATDQLIRKIGKLLNAQKNEVITIATPNKGDFALLLENTSLEKAKKIADRIYASINKSMFIWRGQSMRVSSCISVNQIDRDEKNVDTILVESEIAGDTLSKTGLQGVRVYYRNDRELLQRKDATFWVTRVQNALRDNRFQLYCQTIAPLKKNKEGVHCEILLRLLHDDGKVFSPAMFLGSAERYHLMPAIDRWVIRNTFSQLAGHFRKGYLVDSIWSINLSGQSLDDPDLTEYVYIHLNAFDIPPGNICFEITETAAITNFDRARLSILGLKSLGCHFSLDDFGTGLSTFSYLKKLPVDFLKIDGSFVRDIVSDQVAFTIVSCIVDVAHVMNLKTVAEFVEKRELIESLIEMGVDYGQGYAIEKPMPLQNKLDLIIDSQPSKQNKA